MNYTSKTGALYPKFSKDGKTLLSVNKDVGTYEIPEGVTKIGNGAFSHCKKLYTVVIPDSVIEICFDAFHNCKSLKYINANGVTEIGRWAFSFCDNLEHINTPNLTNIGYGSFGDCNNLKNINSKLSKEQLIIAISGYLKNEEQYIQYLQRNRDYKLKQLENEL